jgi:glucosyl-3-phosphoglycerate synthase
MAAVPALPTDRFHHADFDPEALTRLKEDAVVSVCLPARDEASTVGTIVETIRSDLVDEVALVDEIIVVDDHSTDRTAEVAVAAGAKVVDAAGVLPEYGEGHGKGEALWKSVFSAQGDLLVWCDADIQNFASTIVTGLLGPLLSDPHISFVKGFYDRPVDPQGGGGGRVTELVARPLLSLLFPDLTGFEQPLGGEYAARREVAESLPFVRGYGVDIGLLIDVAERFGPDTMAQVDLDSRVDRNRPLEELSPQALAIIQTALRRAGSRWSSTTAVLRHPGRPDVEVDVSERPPLVDVPAYRRRFF